MFIKRGNFKITFSPRLIKFEMEEVGTCENGWKLKSWSYSDVEVRLGVGVQRRGETFITDITDLTDRPSGNQGWMWGYNSHHSEYDKI